MRARARARARGRCTGGKDRERTRKASRDVCLQGEYKSGYRVSCHVSKISRPNVERERRFERRVFPALSRYAPDFPPTQPTTAGSPHALSLPPSHPPVFSSSPSLTVHSHTHTHTHTQKNTRARARVRAHTHETGENRHTQRALHSSLFRACSIAAHILALVVTRIAHSGTSVYVRPAPTRRQTLTHARIYVYAGIRSRARAMAAAVAAVVHPGGAEYRRAAMFGPRGEEQQHRRCDDGDR